MEKFFQYVDQSRERYIAQLQKLCRQPSVAAEGTGLEETADIVLGMLHDLGAEARLLPVEGGPPVVYAELGQGKKTMAIYDHYDVQPPDPLEEWRSAPFSAEIRDGKMYARGVADNKGDLVARICAIDAYQKAVGPLPLRIKFVIEGEEEIGSLHLEEFAQKHKDLIKADGMVWEGSGKDPSERPFIYFGMKGLAYFELRAQGADHDLHSSWGTVAPDPAWRLTWALATLKDPDENILVDGLMDHFAPPNKEDVEMLRKAPFDEEGYRKNFGIKSWLRGLSGLDLKVRHFLWPTCTINGIKSGYLGPGTKTVLAATASAKVSFRLVPNLDPEVVNKLLRQHLDRRGFSDVEVELLNAEKPAKSDFNSAIAKADRAAIKEIYGQEPIIYPMIAGTGPLYPLSMMLGIPMTSGMGVGHADDRIHSPNENIRVEDYIQVIKYNGVLIQKYAEI